MSIITSPELFINMKSTPVYDGSKNYWEQPDDVLQFYAEEKRKFTEGVNINGVFIHPWLYFHINFFKTPIPQADKSEPIIVPELRDNEWFLAENYQDAELKNKGLVVYGSRRFAKSSMMGSILHWKSITKPNMQATVAGGSTEDLQMITKMIKTSMENVNPAFFMENNKNDWSKHIQLGLKTKANRELVYSDIYIRNLEGGTESKSEKTAGAAPSAYIFDEIGKVDFLASYTAALPSFKTPYGWKCCPILAGTSGNDKLSKDAMKVMMNPEAYDLLPMNWDRLENRIDEKDLITWKRRMFGVFVPGQFGYEDGNIKINTNLKEYLRIKQPSPELEKVKIQETDWALAKNLFLNNRKKLLKDNDEYTKYCMYYPLDIDDLLKAGNDNPFPVKEAQKHKQDLIDTDRIGKFVDLHLEGGKVSYSISQKQPISDFPFRGGTHDAPVILFDEIPEKTPPYGLNVSGLDPYKQTKAGTESVGSLYVLRREGILDDPFAGCILASYASRPPIPDNFDRNCEWLIEAFNAQCLMENADIGFIRYLERKNKADLLLANGVDFSKKINPNASANTPYGIYPTPKNQSHLMKGLLNYCNEELVIGFEEDGTPKKVLGIVRINDIYLLEEIINYKPGGNFDRMIAFAHALAWADYLETIGVKVESGEQQEKKEQTRKVRRNKFINTSGYNKWR